MKVAFFAVLGILCLIGYSAAHIGSRCSRWEEMKEVEK